MFKRHAQKPCLRDMRRNRAIETCAEQCFRDSAETMLQRDKRRNHALKTCTETMHKGHMQDRYYALETCEDKYSRDVNRKQPSGQAWNSNQETPQRACSGDTSDCVRQINRHALALEEKTWLRDLGDMRRPKFSKDVHGQNANTGLQSHSTFVGNMSEHETQGPSRMINLQRKFRGPSRRLPQFNHIRFTETEFRPRSSYHRENRGVVVPLVIGYFRRQTNL